MKLFKFLAIGSTTVMVVIILCGFSELYVMGDGMTECIEGNGKRIEDKRKIDHFKEMSVEGSFDIVIDGGRKTGPVIISAESNLLNHIVMEVKNDMLSITSDKSICAKTPVRINMAGNGIQAIFSNGASDINFSAIANKRLHIKLNGAGTATLSGKTTSLSAEIFGASSLMAKELPAQSVMVKTEGSSSAHVFAKEDLDAFSSGASGILFSGNPSHIAKQELEVGEILPFTAD